MKKRMRFGALGAVALCGAGLLATGCKSAPDLNKTDAATMIQADYDKRPAEPAVIAVDDMGLKQGLNKLWKLTKVYPNMRWADYTLTDEGKKAVKLQNGGNVIEWRPEQGNNDFHFFISTVQANKLKMKDLQEEHDDIVAGVDHAKSADFTEVYDWTGIPDTVQTISHNAINKLSTKRTAEFELTGGAWRLHAIK